MFKERLSEGSNGSTCSKNLKHDLKCIKESQSRIEKLIIQKKENLDMLVNNFSDAPDKIIEPLIGWTYRDLNNEENRLITIEEDIKRLKKQIKNNKKDK